MLFCVRRKLICGTEGEIVVAHGRLPSPARITPLYCIKTFLIKDDFVNVFVPEFKNLRTKCDAGRAPLRNAFFILVYTVQCTFLESKLIAFYRLLIPSFYTSSTIIVMIMIMIVFYLSFEQYVEHD